MNKNKIHVAIAAIMALAAFTLPPCLVQAQDTSRNYVRTVTMLDAGGTDSLLGGALTLRNGRIDKYLFEEGYCQARKYNRNYSQDNFTFCYYDRDHLGNVRQVREANCNNAPFHRSSDILFSFVK